MATAVSLNVSNALYLVIVSYLIKIGQLLLLTYLPTSVSEEMVEYVRFNVYDYLNFIRN